MVPGNAVFRHVKIQYFNFYNFLVLEYSTSLSWGRNIELSTICQIWKITFKYLKKKIVLCYLAIPGIHQLATSSTNKVTGAQFLVTLTTCESQFQDLPY